MAKSDNLLLMGIRGRIGNIVGYTWRGKTVIRRVPGPRKNPPTSLQRQQQEKFKLLMHFLKPLKGIFDISFKPTAKRMSCLNKAVSENKSAITGEYPELRIAYSRVVLSADHRPAEGVANISAFGSGILRFSWDHRLLTEFDRKSDLLFVAVYCEALNKWNIQLIPKVEEEGIYDLNIESFVGYNVYAYMGFKPFVRRPCSFYLGEIDMKRL
jgi:hypothetical protein